MSPRTILTLANGKGIDLLNPRASDVDFAAYAEHLAKEKRFNGATPDLEYSVAQHLCLGSDRILVESSDKYAAAEFSLHDGPEAILKDDTTPKKRAIAELIALRCGVLAPNIIHCFDELTEIHDAAIHQAAGLPWPMPDAVAKSVKRMDIIMFVTEWRDLMGGIAHPDWAPYAGVVPLTPIIAPWPWQIARDALLRRWKRLLPALGGSIE